MAATVSRDGAFAAGAAIADPDAAQGGLAPGRGGSDEAHRGGEGTCQDGAVERQGDAGPGDETRSSLDPRSSAHAAGGALDSGLDRSAGGGGADSAVVRDSGDPVSGRAGDGGGDDLVGPAAGLAGLAADRGSGVDGRSADVADAPFPAAGGDPDRGADRGHGAQRDFALSATSGALVSEEEALPVREDLEVIREMAGVQAGAGSPEDPETVRAQLRGLVRRRGGEGFAAESVQHVMGLTRDGDPVDPELEKELLSELQSAGISLDELKLRYETLTGDERREFTTFEVQQAFRRAVDHVADLTAKASVRIVHRLDAFDRQAAAQLKLVAGIRLLVERETKVVEGLLKDARGLLEQEQKAIEQLLEKEPRDIARAARTELDKNIQKVQQAFEGLEGYVRSYETRVDEVNSKLHSAGSGLTALETEVVQVIRQLRQVADSGFAVKRLALLGGVVGSAVGGFFAFVVMLLLWAATGG